MGWIDSWISIQDARDHHGGTITETLETTNELGIENSSARVLPARTVCLSRTASVGYVVVTGRPMATSQDFVNWVCSDSIEPDCLKYLFMAEGADLLRFASGAVHQTIYFPEAKAFHVCIPSRDEQQRIVSALDDSLHNLGIAQADSERNLLNAKALFANHLDVVFRHRAVGWRRKTIAEIAEHSLGKMLDKAKNKGERKPYLRNVNVRWFSFELSDVLEMRFLPDEFQRYTAVKGDVLVCEGGYPGRAAIWNGDAPVHFQKALHRVRFREPNHNKWFLYYLFAQHGSGELRRSFTRAGIQHFTGEALARFEIPMPPQEVLRPLIGQLDRLFAETRGLETIYRQKLVALSNLKKSLLHEAFSARL